MPNRYLKPFVTHMKKIKQGTDFYSKTHVFVLLVEVFYWDAGELGCNLFPESNN